MQTPPLTENLRGVLERAQREAAQRHGNYLDVEHLMLGLLRDESGTVSRLFRDHQVDPSALYEQVANAVGMERPQPAEVKGYSKWARAALDRAAAEARSLGHTTLDTRHLLLSLMEETDGAVHEALDGLDLTPDDVRASLREDPVAETSRADGRGPAPIGAAEPAAEEKPLEFVLIPTRSRPRRSAQPAARNDTRIWVIAGLALLVVYLAFALPGNSLFTFVVVVIGWVFSVTLHEFAHALVAYLGGDYTVRDKGYLSFNPLKYTHPMTSIALPLLFLAMGGIGLPGGAVYIERHRLRSKWWGAAVSAAGPAANLLLALLLSAPFWLGLVETDIIEFRIWFGSTGPGGGIWEDTNLWSAVAFLAMLQVTAVAFNLLPIPPLDGFGIIEPLLDQRTQFQMRQLGMYGLLLIFIILWTPLGNQFWDVVFDMVGTLHIPGELIREGFRNFMFWRTPPN
jgi:Zn-dependent protease